MTMTITIQFITFILVAMVAFLWPRDMRRNWHRFDPRTKRATIGVIPVFASNAVLLLNASLNRETLPNSVYLLAVSYFILLLSLVYTPKGERHDWKP